MNKITTLFFDLGGVILTNGWDIDCRKSASDLFKLNFEEIERRHKAVFYDFEKGKFSLDDYVSRVIFFKKRDFSKKEFIEYIKSRSKLHKNSFRILQKLSAGSKYFLATINNESYELNLFRINHFKLFNYFKAFFSSGFLNTRKPEPQIFKTALNVLHRTPSECLFIDDRIENIEEAANQKINTIHLTDVKNLESLLIENGIVL